MTQKKKQIIKNCTKKNTQKMVIFIKKKKKKSGRKKKIAFWGDIILHDSLKYLVKYNKSEIGVQTDGFKFYNSDYFYELLLIKEQQYNEYLFDTSENDEFYDFDFFEYNFQYKNFFLIENQLFFLITKNKTLLNYKKIPKKIIMFNSDKKINLNQYCLNYKPNSFKADNSLDFLYKKINYNLN